MIPTTRLLSASALLLLLATGISAAAGLNGGPGAGIPEPILVRVTGFVDTGPPGVSTLGTLTLGIDHRVRKLELTNVQMLNGPLTEGPAALRQHSLYNPNFLVIGNPDVVKQISTAPPQSQLTLFGYIRAGSNRMLVVETDRP